MNIKQKIWLLPAIAILISSANITTNYVLSKLASKALLDAGQADYPAARGWYVRVLDADPRNEEIQGLIGAIDAETASTRPSRVVAIGPGQSKALARYPAAFARSAQA